MNAGREDENDGESGGRKNGAEDGLELWRVGGTRVRVSIKGPVSSFPTDLMLRLEYHDSL